LTFEEATDLFHDQAFDPDAVEFDPAARRIRLTFERTDETPPVPGVRWVLAIDGAEGFELEDKAETGAYLVNEILFDAAEGVIRITDVLPGRFVVKRRGTHRCPFAARERRSRRRRNPSDAGASVRCFSCSSS